MSALADQLQKRIVELSAHQAEIQARADTEKAAVQQQINALLAAKAVLQADPAAEVAFLTLSTLKLLPREN